MEAPGAAGDIGGLSLVCTRCVHVAEAAFVFAQLYTDCATSLTTKDGEASIAYQRPPPSGSSAETISAEPVTLRKDDVVLRISGSNFLNKRVGNASCRHPF